MRSGSENDESIVEIESALPATLISFLLELFGHANALPTMKQKIHGAQFKVFNEMNNLANQKRKSKTQLHNPRLQKPAVAPKPSSSKVPSIKPPAEELSNFEAYFQKKNYQTTENFFKLDKLASSK